MPEIPEKLEVVKKSSIPKIYLSSNKPEQGDTLFVKIEDGSALNEILAEFDSEKIKFFKPKNGEFWLSIIGIDARKKPKRYNLVINLPNGQEIEREIEVIKREFPTTELLVTEELKEKGYTPSKIIENITKRENLILKEVLAVFTPEVYFERSFIYPLKKIEVVGAFGNIRESGEFAIQHLGVDLEAAIGTPVYAINDGIVSFSEELTTYGKTLIIDHGLGIFSLYLHFSVKVNGASVDPLRFIEMSQKEMK